MDAGTRNMLINTALQVAVDATGLVPGLGQVTAALRIANDVAPAVEVAVAYFEGEEGQRAIGHMQALFGALAHSTQEHMTFATPEAHAVANPDGYHLELVWVDAFEGQKYRWIKN